MAGNTVTDYLFQPVGNALSTWQGIYVGLVHNVLGTAYKSTAPTSSTGLWTVQNIPSGVYTVYTSATGTGLPPGGAWSVTPDTAYRVGDATQKFDTADYGATWNGSTDDTAALTNAINDALSAGNGTVIFHPGTAKITASLPTITKPGISIHGPGSEACTIQPTAAVTGDCLRIQMSPFVSTNPVGMFGGFLIDGTNAGAGACGMHYGDAVGGAFRDLIVKHFNKAGSKGIWIDNVTNFTERLSWLRVEVADNTIGILFDKNGGLASMGHQSMIDVRVSATNQTAIQVNDGVAFYDGVFHVTGNIGGGSAIGINLVGTGTLGGVTGGVLFGVSIEASGSGTDLGLQMSATSKLVGSGSIDLSANGITNSNAGGLIQFGGWFNVPGIHTQGAEGLVATGITVPVSLAITDPGIKSDGSSIYLASVAGAGVALRPNGNASANNQFLGTAGTWATYGGTGVARNTIDAGAGHVLFGASGVPSTSALGANVTSVTFTGNDNRGTIAIVMSGALAANTRIATCTYAVTFGATAPFIFLFNQTSGVGLANVNFYRQAVSTGVSFDLACNQALGAGTYTVGYIVQG